MSRRLSRVAPAARGAAWRLVPALLAVLGACSHLPGTTPPVVRVPAPSAAPPSVQKSAPKIGLALGGGGARGFAHIGVIQVLEEAGLRPDYVAGTSVGSLVAALYASGKSGRELQNVAMTLDEAMFSDWRLPLFKPGVLRGDALARFVSAQVQGRQIQELTLPLGILATDLHTGQGVLFRTGDTATAVRASSAVPAVFQPVSIAGREYVDGGLVAPVPVSHVHKMGANLVIAVDISNEPESNEASDTVTVLLKTFAIMGKSINALELRQADVLIKPALAGVSGARFSSRVAAIEAGRQAMLLQLPVLRQLIAARTN